MQEDPELDFAGFRFDKGMTLNPQLQQVVRKVTASFADTCEKALADGAPAPIVRGLYEGVVLNTFRQEAWALVLAEGRHAGLGRCQRWMGTAMRGWGKATCPPPG